MANFDDNEIKLWIILMCNLEERYGGITLEEIYSHANKKLNLSLNKLTEFVSELEKEKLIEFKTKEGHLNIHYLPTQKGKEKLNSIKMGDIQFINLMKLAPPEYELKYRIRNLEFFIFYGILCFMFFKLTESLLKGGLFGWSIPSFILTYFFLILFSSYAGYVTMMPILNNLARFFGKTYTVLDKKANIVGTIITVIIVLLVLLTGYFVAPATFLNNIYWILIGTIIGGITGIKSLRNLIIIMLSKIKLIPKSFLNSLKVDY